MLDSHARPPRLRTRTPQEAVGLAASELEGVGSSALYDNLAPVDAALIVSDTQAIAMCRFLLKHEGFFVGGSAGLNVCGAVLAARQLGPGHTIVTMLCDDGARYLHKNWSAHALEQLGLTEASGDELDFL